MASRSSSQHIGANAIPLLLEDVNTARARMGRDRNSLQGLYPEASSARVALLAALEDYAAAVTKAGWPLPYRLRDELVLYRRLTATGRRPSGR